MNKSVSAPTSIGGPFASQTIKKEAVIRGEQLDPATKVIDGGDGAIGENPSLGMEALGGDRHVNPDEALRRDKAEHGV